MRGAVVVGTAGWPLPRAEQPHFPAEGTHLQRYAARFAGVEIDASFHRPLRRELYAKWADGVPAGFRFSVKLPKSITHERRLLDCEEPLADFLDQAAGLGAKLGCLLVQLPPSFEYDASRAGAFLGLLRALHDGPVALEPRHATWFTRRAAGLLAGYDVARVAADPARVPAAGSPGGSTDLVYHRLHGSPRVYWSPYGEDDLRALAARIARAARRARTVWCIFDNTAGSAATPNALQLLERLPVALSDRSPATGRRRRADSGPP